MKNPINLAFKTACLLSIICICSCGEEKPSGNEHADEIAPPAQIIDIAQAKNYYELYGKRRVPLIQRYEDSINKAKKTKAGKEENKAFDVGRFVSYDYKTIKQYLKFIEQEAAASGVEISTLRFYYSNYPDEAFYPNSKEPLKHPRQNSIMLSPTFTNETGEHLFYIAGGAEGKQAVPLSNDFKNSNGYSTSEQKPTKAYASFAPGLNATVAEPKNLLESQSLTLNRGSGVPPPKY